MHETAGTFRQRQHSINSFTAQCTANNATNARWKTFHRFNVIRAYEGGEVALLNGGGQILVGEPGVRPVAQQGPRYCGVRHRVVASGYYAVFLFVPADLISKNFEYRFDSAAWIRGHEEEATLKQRSKRKFVNSVAGRKKVHC